MLDPPRLAPPDSPLAALIHKHADFWPDPQVAVHADRLTRGWPDADTAADRSTYNHLREHGCA